MHIAPISSSDEDYLDFEEADDFEVEDEFTQARAAGNIAAPHGHKHKSFINSSSK